MVIIAIVVIILVCIILEYNTMLKLRNKVKQSKSSIDVYLTQRFDLIPNLVNCVKGYMEYEKDLIENITKMRAEYYKNKNLEIGKELNQSLNILALANERYPELKANEQFLELQKSISKMEKQLQAARRLYNSDVTSYNSKIQVFPINILAKFFGFYEEKLFELEEFKSENVKIDL